MRNIILLVAACLISLSSISQNLTDYVNPFIGSTNYGTTNPGPITPNGMMSVAPFNVMGSTINKFGTTDAA